MNDRRLTRLLFGARRRTLIAAALGLAILVGGVALVVADPFGGAHAAAVDNGSPSAFATVTRRSLTSQTQADATLGYAGASSIVAPAGTALADRQQTEQAVAAARTALQATQQTLTSDQQALDLAQATLSANRERQAGDCRGDAAAAAATAATDASSAKNSRSSQPSSQQPSVGNGGSGSTPCAGATAAAASAAQDVTSAAQKVTADQAQVATARTQLTGAEQAAETARGSATINDAGSAYTRLPAVGAIVRRGQALYSIDDEPVLLFYGRTPAWRAFRPGMSPGSDVAEFNANLAALGYGDGLAGSAVTSGTEAAILNLQAAHGLPGTGELPLGSVVFEAGAVRVTNVRVSLGQPAQPGPVLDVTSLQHQVTIDLDASEQASVKVGDRVTVTLPDNETTPGIVSFVGSVATAPPSTNASTAGGSGSGSTSPTIEVDVHLLHGQAAGSLDQAPVQVSITTASVRDALVVPIDALLALTGGGYALEVVTPTGHELVPVDVGLFDDAEGRVQVTGSDVHAGQRIVVPSS